MVKACDLRQKEVINIENAEKLGYIRDVEINFETGIIEAIIIPKKLNLTNVFSDKRDYVILWENIVRVGPEVVLVKYTED